MYKANATGAGLRRLIPWALALLVLLLTVAIYATGLHGPYLLDDIGNLEPLKRWLDGTLGWQGVVFDNRSGPGGRPLSMATFLADAWLAGDMDSFAFKATNLGIHLACGVVAFALALQVFIRGGITQRHAPWLAAFAALAWLWLPTQVSTVLYVVQRMAQLAVLLTFAALALFMLARRRIEQGRRSGTLMLWIGVPLVTLLAAAAKETGVLALPLAAALEYTLFAHRTRPRQVNLFFALAVGVPAVIGVAFVTLRPDWILGGYANRDFTLAQRLMTEPRVLWSYLQTTVFPVGPRMGLFHDNYPISTGWMAPWTTTTAVVAWLAAIAAALFLRRKAPLFTLGVAGYLIAHALEGGPIGLELYFEHRNYGAALFALIAIVGLLRWIIGTGAEKPHIRRVLALCAVACLAIYGLGTWSQAAAWRDEQTFYSVQYGYNPTSPRLLSNLTGRAIMVHDLDRALFFIGEGERYGADSERAAATLWRMLAYCEANGPKAPESLYDEFTRRATGRVTTYTMVAWELLANRSTEGCASVDVERAATTMLKWLDTSSQPAGEQIVWRTRYNAGRVIADAGHIDEGRRVVRRAWLDSGRNNGIGVLLFQLDATLGDVAGCRETLGALARAEGGPDKKLNEAIRTFRDALDQGQIQATTP